jgi:RHS repeat-associated protein
VAAIWSQATSAWADAFRYDPWGETIAHSPTSSARSPWRYQGRLVEGEASDAELYDFGFRSYAADTGAFASLDDVAGSAHDVRTLNRFLYANADPATLIDPDGHAATQGGEGVGGSSSPAAIAKAKKAATDSITHPRTDSADAGSSSTPTRSVKADDWSGDATSRVLPLWLQRKLAGYPDLPYEPGCESQAFPQPCADFNGRSGYEGACTGPDGPVSWNCAAGMLVLPVLVAAILTVGTIGSEVAIMVELGGSASACWVSGVCQRLQGGLQATYGAVTGEPTPAGGAGRGATAGGVASIDASSALQGAQPRTHLRLEATYGQAGVRELESGALRYYGVRRPASRPGEMVGTRLVREWNPRNGATRTWFETVDNSGRVRIVRPETGGAKIHFIFDAEGRYVGNR